VNPRRASVRKRPSGRRRIRISAGNKNLGAAGHRDLLVLRAAERDVRNGKKGSGAERRTALRRGKALKGEPHEWHRSSGIERQWREQAVRRVRNPEDGTNRAGRPGEWTSLSMSLKGRRTSGGFVVPRGTAGGDTVYPEEECDPMDASGAQAPGDRDPEDREAVETAGRGS
jgi:hypothetical protein